MRKKTLFLIFFIISLLVFFSDRVYAREVMFVDCDNFGSIYFEPLSGNYSRAIFTNNTFTGFPWRVIWYDGDNTKINTKDSIRKGMCPITIKAYYKDCSGRSGDCLESDLDDNHYDYFGQKSASSVYYIDNYKLLKYTVKIKNLNTNDYICDNNNKCEFTFMEVFDNDGNYGYIYDGRDENFFMQSFGAYYNIIGTINNSLEGSQEIIYYDAGPSYTLSSYVLAKRIMSFRENYFDISNSEFWYSSNNSTYIELAPLAHEFYKYILYSNYVDNNYNGNVDDIIKDQTPGYFNDFFQQYNTSHLPFENVDSNGIKDYVNNIVIEVTNEVALEEGNKERAFDWEEKEEIFKEFYSLFLTRKNNYDQFKSDHGALLSEVNKIVDAIDKSNTQNLFDNYELENVVNDIVTSKDDLLGLLGNDATIPDISNSCGYIGNTYSDSSDYALDVLACHYFNVGVSEFDTLVGFNQEPLVFSVFSKAMKEALNYIFYQKIIFQLMNLKSRLEMILLTLLKHFCT